MGNRENMKKSSSGDAKQAPKASNKKIKVSYEDVSVRYANQILINGSAEDIFLDFSSGPIPGSDAGETLLPIHSRIAMTHAGARRLQVALQRALKNIDASKASDDDSSPSLPPLPNG